MAAPQMPIKRAAEASSAVLLLYAFAGADFSMAFNG